MNRYVAVCVTLSVFFAALYVADTNGFFKKASHPIAQIKDSTRTVRRLPNDGLTWDRARKGTQLEIGDTISTGDRAEAKIAFNAGGLLTLDSGSMVVLSGDPEELQLNFLSGGAHLQVTKEGQTKIKVVQPVAKNTNSKLKRIRSAVEVTSVDQLAVAETQPKTSPIIKSELSDAPTAVISKVIIKPPELLYPQTDAHFLYPAGGKQSVEFTWAPVLTAKTYHLYVETLAGLTLFDEDVKDTKHILENLEPGDYQWSVYSVSENLQFSDSSITRRFILDDVPKVQWVGDSQNQTYYYVTPKPTLKISWILDRKIAEKNPTFKVTIQQEGSQSQNQSFITKEFSKIINLPKDGVYQETVEFVSESGMSLSTSPLKKTSVVIYPLLGPPAFNERQPASIQASRNGSTELGWVSVSKASGYEITIVDSKGKPFKDDRVKLTTYSIKGLLPGDYFVKLSSIDAYGRLGPFGPEKKIHVPDVSDVKGPNFKKFEIK